MSWIILGLVFLVVTYLSLKGTVLEEYSGKDKVDEYHVPMWVLLILGLLYIIPIFGIIGFIAYNIVFLIFALRKPAKYYNRIILRLSGKNILHRILGGVIYFLTKEIQ